MSQAGKVTLASQLGSVTATAIGAYLPGVRDLRIAEVPDPGRTGIPSRFFVRGTLPDGSHYEVPLEIEVGSLFRDSRSVWLASVELAEAVKLAVRSFKAMCALCPEEPRRLTDVFPNGIALVRDTVYGFAGSEGPIISGE